MPDIKRPTKPSLSECPVCGVPMVWHVGKYFSSWRMFHKSDCTFSLQRARAAARQAHVRLTSLRRGKRCA